MAGRCDTRLIGYSFILTMQIFWFIFSENSEPCAIILLIFLPKLLVKHGRSIEIT